MGSEVVDPFLPMARFVATFLYVAGVSPLFNHIWIELHPPTVTRTVRPDPFPSFCMLIGPILTQPRKSFFDQLRTLRFADPTSIAFLSPGASSVVLLTLPERPAPSSPAPVAVNIHSAV